MKKSVLVLSAFLITLLFSLSAFAQESTLSSLSGTVTDAQNATVSGAAVTVRNTATGQERTVTTNDQGNFVVPQLLPGDYTVTVEAKGFKKAVAPHIAVEISKEASVTIALEVGNVGETVTVTATQDVINTSTPSLTNVINTRQVQDLPLPTRNPLDLAGLQPGVAVTGTDNRGSSISGLRQTAVHLTQDGINAMDNFVKTSSLFAISAPSLNSTSEFSISTGTIDSTSGRGVGQVKLVTQGGSNDFHGQGFYLVRSDSLEANSWFNNATKVPRPKEHQHFFGFSAGGRMFLPIPGEGGKSVWNGRDKAFWFFSYEGFRENFQATRNRTVLTPLARTGLFRYTGSDGSLQTVNLLTLPGTTFHSLNAITTAQLNAMPGFNNTDVGDGLNTAGFRFNVTGTDPNDKYVFRYDHQIVEKSALGGHKVEFVYNRAKFLLTPDTFNGIEAPFPGGVDAFQASTRSLMTIADHMTFGNISNEFRWGRQWAPVQFLRDSNPTTYLLGLSSVTNFDNSFVSQGRNTIVSQIIDNMAMPKGNHTFRFGADYQQIYADTFNDAGIFQTINIGSNSSNGDGITRSSFSLLPAGATGDAIVTRAQNIYRDLVGLLASTTQTFNVTSPTSGFVPGATRSRIFKERDLAFYGQDQWRFRSNITLNLGLRWEFMGVPTIPNGLAIQLTNPNNVFGITGNINNLFNPNAPAGAAPAIGVLDFVSGTTGKGLYNNDYNNFAPFFGFAWSPNFKSGLLHKVFGDEGTSSFRGGYSISYLHDGFTTISNALGTGVTNPGLIQAAQLTTPTGVLTGAGLPLTTPTFTIPITDRANNLITPNNGLWAIDPNIRTPYVQQWSLGYEREIAKNTAVEVRYVGNHAIKVWRAIDFNEINIFENQFLREFNNARINLAARGGTSFAPGCAGCVALPIFTAFFTGNGVPGAVTVTNANGFGSSTFISNLNNNNVGTLASTLATSNTYRTNRELPAVGIPANFFMANPNAAFARWLTNDSMSNYHALEVEVRRRLSAGLQFQANYTFSKALTDARDALGNNQSDLVSFRTLRNKILDYARSNQDQTHRFVANGIYDLPFGTGKKYFSGANGVVDRIVGGWSLGGIVVWQSRPPLYFTSNRTTFNNFNAGNNPAQLVGITYEELQKNLGLFRHATGLYFVNPSLLNITTNPTTGAFSQSTLKPGLLAAPAPGTFGDFPINSLAGPTYFNIDASLVKRFAITETTRLEIKTTAINVLNHPNFVYNGNTFDSTSFGRITSTSGNPRIVHFTMKLIW